MGDGDANEDNSEDGDEDCSDDGGGADEGADGDNDGGVNSSSEMRILGFRAQTVTAVQRALPRQAQPLGLGLTCFPGACSYHGFSLPLSLVSYQSCDSVLSLQSVEADSKEAPCTSKGRGPENSSLRMV